MQILRGNLVGFFGPDFETSPEFFREATRMMPKGPHSLKGFFANHATNKLPCCWIATTIQAPENTRASSFPGSGAAMKALPTK